MSLYTELHAHTAGPGKLRALGGGGGSNTLSHLSLPRTRLTGSVQLEEQVCQNRIGKTCTHIVSNRTKEPTLM